MMTSVMMNSVFKHENFRVHFVPFLFLMKSLILDHQHVPFDKLLPKIDTDVSYLSLNNCALTSLANFPKMSNLTKVLL